MFTWKLWEFEETVKKLEHWIFAKNKQLSTELNRRLFI